MVKFINKFDISYKHQYGFRKGHNTSHPPIHFLGKIYDSLNKRDPDFTLFNIHWSKKGIWRM